MEDLSVEVVMPETLNLAEVQVPQTPIAECQTFNWFKGEKGDKGDKGDTGNTGATGQDGFSPTANVTKSGDTVTISITDKTGTTTESIVSGEGKATANLSNIDNTNNAASTSLNTAGIRTVIETYSSGTDWYRVWSDGWCEQGGYITSTNNTAQNINLLKSYANTNYFVTTQQVTEGATVTEYYGDNKIIARTTTYFTFVNAQSELPYYVWKAEGYVS